MANALEMFRKQREVAEQVIVKLQEVASLLGAPRQQANALAGDADLRAVLRQESEWLVEAQRTVAAVRAFREAERHRFWPAVWRRWAVALAFALLSPCAAGVGYGWFNEPHESEMSDLRLRAEFGDAISRRLQTITAAELRQCDALMIRRDSPRTRSR